jgi:hypothetical protein
MTTLALLAALAIIAALITSVVVDGPVSRRRVERFADRHALTVTADNGPQIITYLAITRRWRSAGLIGGAMYHLLSELQHHRAGVSLTSMLAGWFVGALLAEVRVAGITTGRRAASLTARTPKRYVSRISRWALFGSVLAFVVLTATAVGGTDPRQLPVPLVVAAVMVAVIVLVVALTSRRVLRRPQPVAAADVLAADDAIRSRSLHAVTGSSVTLILYCTFEPVSLLVAGDVTESAAVLLLIAAVAVPLVGVRLTTARWVVRRDTAIA